MSYTLPTPRAQKPKAPKARKTSKGRVIHTGTVEPEPGWNVSFAIVEDKTKVSEYNPDGHFVRFTGGVSWQPDKSVGTAKAYAAVIDSLRGTNS